MVHPLLQSSRSLATFSDNPLPTPDTRDLAEPIISFLQRLHVLVIGPGLGRDTKTQEIVVEVIEEAKSQNIPIVLDADALLLVQQKPDLIKGYPECILTPNVVEFARLAKALGVDISIKNESENKQGDNEQEKARNRESQACERLSSALGGVTIIQKGKQDIISNGITSLICDVEGGLKRSGGQGDTLTGSLGTFFAWRKMFHEGLWDTNEQSEASSRDAVNTELSSSASDDKKKRMSTRTTLLLVAFAGSAITRECSRRAYRLKGRSMQASDLTDEVHGSFLTLIGEPEESKL